MFCYLLDESCSFFQLCNFLAHYWFYRSPTQSAAVIQPAPVTNPFGTLPAMPQMSIGRGGTAPSVQYGISSMPVSMHHLWDSFSFEILVLV